MTALTRTTTSKTILIIIAAFLIYGLVAGLRAMSGVFVVEIANISGFSYGAISSVATVRNLVYAFACPFWGLMTLRRSYTFVLALGLLLTAIGFGGVLLVPTYLGLIIFQGIFFGIGAGAVCYSITYAASAPFLAPKSAAIFAGILSMAQGTFNIILTPIVKASSAFDGGFIICMICIALAIAAIIPLTFFFKWRNQHTEAIACAASQDSTRSSISMKKVLKTMAKTPFFYLVAISFFIYGLCQGEMMNHLLKRGTETMGLSIEGATVLVMLYGVALVVGPFLGGLIVSRVGNKRFALAAMFLGWAAIAFLLCSGSFATGVVVTFIVILGVVISMALPFHAVLAQERVPIKYFAAMFSIIATFEVFGYAVNSFLGGLVFDLTNSFLACDIIVILLAFIIGIVYIIDGYRSRHRVVRW